MVNTIYLLNIVLSILLGKLLDLVFLHISMQLICKYKFHFIVIGS